MSDIASDAATSGTCARAEDAPRTTQLRRRALLLAVASTTTVWLGLAVLLRWAPAPSAIDRGASRLLYAPNGRPIHHAAAIVTLLGAVPVAGVLSLAFAAWAWRHWHDLGRALFCPAVVASSVFAVQVLKRIVGRPRPPTAALIQEGGLSYPSGHGAAAAALAFAVVLAFGSMVPRRRATASVLAVAYLTAVAASRLVLGVHYLTDVVGAIALGGALACGAALAAVFDARSGTQPSA